MTHEEIAKEYAECNAKLNELQLRLNALIAEPDSTKYYALKREQEKVRHRWFYLHYRMPYKEATFRPRDPAEVKLWYSTPLFG
jgi:hypothetical protein